MFYSILYDSALFHGIVSGEIEECKKFDYENGESDFRGYTVIDGDLYYKENDQVIYCNQKTGEEIYWEHFGMVDVPTYAKKMVKKIETYENNNLFIGENLICTYETEESIYFGADERTGEGAVFGVIQAGGAVVESAWIYKGSESNPHLGVPLSVVVSDRGLSADTAV